MTMKLRVALAAILLSAPAFAQGTPPSIKAPTQPAQAANKAYVDGLVADKISDAPNNGGTYYLRRNGAWTAFGGPTIDAPSDGQVYGRSNGVWAAIGSGGTASVTNSSVISALGYTPAPEAPSDGTYYVRRNAGWIGIPAPTSGQITTALGYAPLADAPNNSTQYVRQGGAWVANSAATVTSSAVTTALGYTPANKAGDTFSGPVYATYFGHAPQVAAEASSGCNTSEYHGFVGGIMAPNITCSVTKISGALDVPFASPTGIPNTTNGAPAADNDQTYINYTQALIQGKTTKQQPQESTLTVSTQIQTGATGNVTTPDGSFGQKIGLYVPTVVLPGAGNSWAINENLVVAPNVGNFSMWRHEGDLTNFNCDVITGACGNIAGDFLTFTGKRITAGLWMTTGGIDAGSPANMQYGMLFSSVSGKTAVGTGLIALDTISDATNATNTLHVWGSHTNVVNTLDATSITNVVNMKDGQRIAFNAGDKYLSTAGNYLTYTQGGNSVLEAVGGGVNGIQLAQASSGSPPLVQPASTGDANVGLGLKGKGSGGVFVYSPAAFSSSATFNNGGLGLGVWGGNSSENSLTFNGTHATNANMGFYGAVGDNYLYGNVPANGTYRLKVAGADAFIVGTNGFNAYNTGTGAVCGHVVSTSVETVSCSSDERLKKDIVDAGPALPKIDDMRIRQFTEKATGERVIGTIAQEMQKTHPEMVHEGTNGMLTVDTPSPWVMVKAIQELRADNDDLRTELRIAEAIGALGLIGLGLCCWQRRRAA